MLDTDSILCGTNLKLSNVSVIYGPISKGKKRFKSIVRKGNDSGDHERSREQGVSTRITASFMLPTGKFRLLKDVFEIAVSSLILWQKISII